MKKPNVIVIYADDLGYGDLSCYGASSISTPNVDALCESGVRFYNGYSTSAVCTPARYSLLTGEYPFRNEYTRILQGDARCIISKEQMTLPKVFKQASYNTAAIGKWHLGMGDGSIDWNEQINHCPNDLGFDYSFIFPGTNDRVPCVYVKNGLVQNLDKNDPISVYYGAECPFEDIDTYEKNPEKLRFTSSCGHCHSLINGVGRIGYMKGGEKAIWKDEDLADTFLGEVTNFIDNSADPFFVFYALHQPHVPRLPNKKFEGKSGLGSRGDVILELDYCVGELTKHLEEKGILEDTIIIFSSDNGPVVDDGYNDLAFEKLGVHKPAGPLRGGKYSKFDGGARVPLIVSWKGKIAEKNSAALVSQVDFANSFASMLGVTLNDGECVDSFNVLDALLGNTEKARDYYMFESAEKAHVLRMGKWAYLEPSEGEKIVGHTYIESGNSPEMQLYNMMYDIGQKENIHENYSEISKEMQVKIDEILASKQTR